MKESPLPPPIQAVLSNLRLPNLFVSNPSKDPAITDLIKPLLFSLFFSPCLCVSVVNFLQKIAVI